MIIRLIVWAIILGLMIIQARKTRNRKTAKDPAISGNNEAAR
jgi:heme/copper-type cytochrome/quinol oxidase subunit 2